MANRTDPALKRQQDIIQGLEAQMEELDVEQADFVASITEKKAQLKKRKQDAVNKLYATMERRSAIPSESMPLRIKKEAVEVLDISDDEMPTTRVSLHNRGQPGAAGMTPSTLIPANRLATGDRTASIGQEHSHSYAAANSTSTPVNSAAANPRDPISVGGAASLDRDLLKRGHPDVSAQSDVKRARKSSSVKGIARASMFEPIVAKYPTIVRNPHDPDGAVELRCQEEGCRANYRKDPNRFLAGGSGFHAHYHICHPNQFATVFNGKTTYRGVAVHCIEKVLTADELEQVFAKTYHVDEYMTAGRSVVRAIKTARPAVRDGDGIAQDGVKMSSSSTGLQDSVERSAHDEGERQYLPRFRPGKRNVPMPSRPTEDCNLGNTKTEDEDQTAV